MPSLSYPQLKFKDKDGHFFIVKNGCGYLLRKEDNDKKLKIYEDREKETIYIENVLNNDEYCVVGHELKPPFLGNDVMRVDFFFIFFQPKTKSASVYVYEIKKSIGNSDTIILDMLLQCSASMKFADFIVDSQEIFCNLNKNVGVFTENLNRNALKNLVAMKERQMKRPAAGFLGKKQSAQGCISKEKLSILKNFVAEKVVINGKPMKFDFREMSKKTHSYSAKIENGVMKKRVPSF
ncbi:MAG: hypothetical protein J5534_13090 [Fibrobacter sp.]|nr:hypothetical protein [Fibrobacter sp.]